MSTTAPVKEISAEDIIKNKQPLWDYAYSKTVSDGQSIKIPIDFGISGRYADFFVADRF